MKKKVQSLEAVEALAFDMFGTVVDWRTGVIKAGRQAQERTGISADWESFADDWRCGYEPAMEEVRSGRRPFELIDVLHREILDRLLADRGMQFSAVDRAWFNNVWHRLPAWSDMHLGLEKLKRKFIVCALSNGNVSLLEDLASYNSLSFDHVISAEHARSYKPQSAVYETAAARIGISPEKILMVAAHDEDLLGARSTGFRTAFLQRPDEWGEGKGSEVPKIQHDADVISCTALAEVL